MKIVIKYENPEVMMDIVENLELELAPYGWIEYNSGPCGWFWSEKRNSWHELTEEQRPATAFEKYIMNQIGNEFIPGEHGAAKYHLP